MKIQDLFETRVINVANGNKRHGNSNQIYESGRSFSIIQDQMGHWDDQQKKWVGYRYSGYLPNHVQVGNLTFEEHIRHLFSQDRAQEILNSINSKNLRTIIAMALNGYTSEMIAEKVYPSQRVEDDLKKVRTSIISQLAKVRRLWKIPIPSALATRVDSVLAQALELKKKLYRANNPHANSDTAVANLLFQHGVSTEKSIMSLLSQHRKMMTDNNVPIPVWMARAPSRQ